jgi:hypothetical protein
MRRCTLHVSTFPWTSSGDYLYASARHFSSAFEKTIESQRLISSPLNHLDSFVQTRYGMADLCFTLFSSVVTTPYSVVGNDLRFGGNSCPHVLKTRHELNQQYKKVEYYFPWLITYSTQHKSRRMKWRGHISSMERRETRTKFYPETLRRNAKKLDTHEKVILKWNLEKWCGGEDWIHMAHGRDRWRSLASTIMNLLASWSHERLVDPEKGLLSVGIVIHKLNRRL